MNHEFWRAIDKIVHTSKVVIDWPKGTSHPRFSNFIYKVDYGFLKRTSSMDDGGIDVWKGTNESFGVDAIMYIVDLSKKDS